MRRTLVQIPDRVLRLKASGCLPVGESARLSCAPLPWRRFPQPGRLVIPAAAAAARAAGLAAASAYTHPLADVQQTKHIVGPAAYAALALELDHAGDPNIGDGEVRWAIEHAPPEVRRGLAADARSPTG